MKKKKNRPLFPNGYNKRGKGKNMNVLKIGDYRKRALDVLNKSLSQITKRRAYREGLKLDAMTKKFEKAIESRRITLLDEAIKSVNANEFKRVREKTFVKWLSYFPTDLQITENGDMIYTEKTAWTNMILRSLSKAGVDIYDPLAVNKTTMGLSAEDIYEVVKNYRSKFKNPYEDLTNDYGKFFRRIYYYHLKLQKQAQLDAQLVSKLSLVKK